MPVHKPRITEFSTSDLEYLTRRRPGSIRRRQLEEADLKSVREDGKTLWWDGRAVFRVLTQRGPDAAAQKARLDAARADAQELRNRVARRELVPASDMEAALIALVTLTRGRILSLGDRIAPELAVETSVARCKAIVDAAAAEALSEMSRRGREAEAELERAGGGEFGARR